MEQNEILFKQVAPAHLQVFLSTEGLTQADANHKANMVKESLQPNEDVWLHTNSHNQLVNFEGVDVETTAFKKIDLVKESLVAGNMNALAAWLREGIKAKAGILQSLETCSTEKFKLEDDEDEPEFRQATMPNQEYVHLKQVSENDIIAEWSIKDRCEYLTLESQAAGVGKKIHNKGEVQQLRLNLSKMKPNEFVNMPDGSGLDRKGGKTYLVKNIPLYNRDEVDTAFMELQELHRGFEQRLNYLKAKIKNDTNVRNQELREEYTKEMKAVNERNRLAQVEYNKLLTEIGDETREYQSKLEKRRLQLVKYVSALRIVVPESLQVVIDNLNVKEVKK